MPNHGSLIIQNQTVIDADQNVPVGEGRKISRSNGKGSNRDEVAFKVELLNTPLLLDKLSISHI